MNCLMHEDVLVAKSLPYSDVIYLYSDNSKGSWVAKKEPLLPEKLLTGRISSPGSVVELGTQCKLN